MAICAHVDERDLFNCQLCHSQGGRYVYEIVGDNRIGKCDFSEAASREGLAAVGAALGIGIVILVIFAVR